METSNGKAALAKRVVRKLWLTALALSALLWVGVTGFQIVAGLHDSRLREATCTTGPWQKSARPDFDDSKPFCVRDEDDGQFYLHYNYRWGDRDNEVDPWGTALPLSGISFLPLIAIWFGGKWAHWLVR